MSHTIAALRKRILGLRMRVKRLMHGVAPGAWLVRSSSHDGFEFDVLREYQEGDDIRRIDWHSSARGYRLMVRSYQESKRPVAVILLDETASMNVGSSAHLKNEIARELAVTLGCLIEQKEGSLGFIRMMQHGYTAFPCRGGRSYFQYLYEMILQEPSEEKRHPGVLEIMRFVPKGALLFFITDGTDEVCNRVITSCGRKAHMLYFRVRDRYEGHASLPCGLVVQDPETNKTYHVMAQASRAQLLHSIQSWYAAQDKLLRSARVPCIDIVAGIPYDKHIRSFLERGI